MSFLDGQRRKRNQCSRRTSGFTVIDVALVDGTRRGIFNRVFFTSKITNGSTTTMALLGVSGEPCLARILVMRAGNGDSCTLISDNVLIFALEEITHAAGLNEDPEPRLA
jgi:hypothetical protein